MADRRQTYNAKRHKLIVELVRKGSYRATAAKQVGMHPSTLSRWLIEGQDDPESQYRALYEDIEQAEAEWENERLGQISDVASSGRPNSWQANAWLLERRMPDKYGRNDRVTVEGGERPIEVATHHLLANPEALQGLLGQLAAMQTPAPVGEEIEGELLAIEEGGELS